MNDAIAKAKAWLEAASLGAWACRDTNVIVRPNGGQDDYLGEFGPSQVGARETAANARLAVLGPVAVVLAEALGDLLADAEDEFDGEPRYRPERIPAARSALAAFEAAVENGE